MKEYSLESFNGVLSFYSNNEVRVYYKNNDILKKLHVTRISNLFSHIEKAATGKCHTTNTENISHRTFPADL